MVTFTDVLDVELPLECPVTGEWYRVRFVQAPAARARVYSCSRFPEGVGCDAFCQRSGAAAVAAIVAEGRARPMSSVRSYRA